MTTETMTFTPVCGIDDILPNCGVAALVEGRHVAVFRLVTSDNASEYFAIDNIDPKSGASVISRGLIGSLGDRVVVASPLYKNHFDLRTGECLEAMEHSVRAHTVHIEDGQLMVALG